MRIIVLSSRDQHLLLKGRGLCHKATQYLVLLSLIRYTSALAVRRHVHLRTCRAQPGGITNSLNTMGSSPMPFFVATFREQRIFSLAHV
jgi:hypothetical protein